MYYASYYLFRQGSWSPEQDSAATHYSPSKPTEPALDAEGWQIPTEDATPAADSWVRLHACSR